MENYRRLLNRYSTGLGPDFTQDLPNSPLELTAFKMEPLYHRLQKNNLNVDLRREADRLSMQLEDASRIASRIGRSKATLHRYENLRKRTEFLRNILLNSSVKYLSRKDLNQIYDALEHGKDVKSAVKEAVKRSQNIKGTTPRAKRKLNVAGETAAFDQFGPRFEFGEFSISSCGPFWLGAIALAAVLWLKFAK